MKVIIVIVSLFFLSCSDSSVNDVLTSKRKNIICLIDYSSTIAPETFDRYVKFISEEVFVNLGKNDQIMVLPIDGGSLSRPEYLLHENLNDIDFVSHKDGFANKESIERGRVKDYLVSRVDSVAKLIVGKRVSRSKFSNKSDILSALKQASENFEKNVTTTTDNVLNYAKGEKSIESENVIIVCSDMIHESSILNLMDVSRNELVDVESFQVNVIKADLDGASVYVHGRTADNDMQLKNIENFWVEYFKASNAKLMAYSYDCQPKIKQLLK